MSMDARLVDVTERWVPPLGMAAVLDVVRDRPEPARAR